MVSIIIPLHNKGPFVIETIHSVLDQTETEWELIIVENGSSDDGPYAVSQIDDDRIKLLFAPARVKGPGAARNFGLDHASGKWVLFLDADDLMATEHLRTLLDVGEKRQTDIVVSGWREFRDSDPTSVEDKNPTGRSEAGSNIADSAIAFAPWAVHCALVRRKVLTEEFRWLDKLDAFASEDTPFWFKLVNYHSVSFSDKNSAIYRTHTDNYRNQFDDLSKWYDAMHEVTTANMDFLKSRNQFPNAIQYENLMRLWSDIAERALTIGQIEIFKKACAKSQRWMDECRANGGANSFALRVRSILTVRRFQQIKRWVYPK